VRRTAALLTALLAMGLGLAACGGNVKVNFDKNGREKACTALGSVKAEVGELSDPNATVGAAQTRLADVKQKLVDATDTKTGFTKSVLAPVTGALDAASEKLQDVDPAKPLAEVPGAAEAQSKVTAAFDSANKLFKCT
jgi:phosphoribosylformylglycinamidine (FGAM) synthase-like enzyme